MTSTSLKDVGSAANSFFMGNASAAGSKTVGASFQEIWNSQTGSGQNTENAQNSRIQKLENSVKGQNANEQDSVVTGQSLKDKHAKTVQPEKVETGDSNEMSEEELKKAMEVLGTATGQLMQQIADIFGISMEELQDTMDAMQLQPTDILQPQNMSALLLEVGGAQDSLSLLTNEELYGKFQTIMQQLDTTLQAAGEELGVNMEQLLQQENVIAENAMSQNPEGEIPIEIQGDTNLAEEQPETNMQSVQASEQLTQKPLRMEEPQETAPTEEGTQQIGTVETEQPAKTSGQSAGQQSNQTKQDADSKGNEQNLFQQNLKTDSTNAQIQQLAEPTLTWDTDTQDIMKQIMDYMKLQVKSDTTNLEMQLHPASLGTLQVQVASKGGVVTAHFVTQNETVKAALESQMVQLKENFQEQGVKVEAIEVSVQAHAFERNLDQGRGRQQDDTRKPRSRRINLNELSDSGLEEMEEEDAIAADMMAANGNTVDYTV